MKKRVYGMTASVILVITACFAVLTVLFSFGVSVNFDGVIVKLLLSAGAVLSLSAVVFARPAGGKTKKIGFYLTHAGAVVLLVGFALYDLAGESISATVPVGSETYYSSIQRENGEICDLGFNFRIDSFVTDTYDDGSDRQYTADLSFADAVTLKIDTLQLSVNHTIRRNGWKIYLMSHTTDDGAEYVNLLFRHDPGEVLVKLGAVMMISGTVLELIIANAHRRRKKTTGEGTLHE